MPADALRTLASGTVDLIPEGELARKLAEARPLVVKLGVDPSRADLTLGHAVVLGKLREFQDAGHRAVLIVGDFTARIGDPSGRSETRPMLSEEEIEENARTYLEQAGKVLDVGAAEVRRNSEWLAGLDMAEVLRLTSIATIAQMLDRDDFQERYRAGRPIGLVEFLYPLLQGYDSVAVRADVELGGTDQTFNLLMGREVQAAYGQERQVVVTLPLLEGTDGVRKMSKSLDNFIGLTEPPDEMFGKLMRIPDGLIAKYFRFTTRRPAAELDRIEGELEEGTLHPNEAKRRLAREVVDRYHGEGEGLAAEERFNLVHREREVPADVPEVRVPASVFVSKGDGGWAVLVPALLEAMGLVSSRSEARRLQAQGGVRKDGEQVPQEDLRVEGVPPGQFAGSVWQVGRRKFARLAGVQRSADRRPGRGPG
jgi:tyrosyl-tRNA synthetase